MDTSRAPQPDEIVFGDFVRPLAARWRRLVAASVVGAALALAAALVWPKSYTAEVSFTPEQSSNGSLGDALGSLGGVGALVGGGGGLTAGLAGPTANSPEFFAGVLKSRELMVSTLQSAFRDPSEPARRRTLLELLKPRGKTPARRLGNARRKLGGKATVTVERRTGLVTLAVTLGDPQLAADVANRMTDLLNVYNLERRQSTSRQQRRFTEARLAQAERELAEAERAQTAFLVENRFIRGSPALQERATRLGRTVMLRQDLVLGLRKSYEDARIAEVRDTPVLSIVDHAAPPDRPASPRPLLWTIGGAALGLVAAAISVWGALAVRSHDPSTARAPARPRAGAPDAAALVDGWASAGRAPDRA